MKKIISLILVLVFVATAFVGCNNKPVSSSKPDSSSETTPSDTVTSEIISSDVISSEESSQATSTDGTSSDTNPEDVTVSTPSESIENKPNSSKKLVPATTKKSFEALSAEYSVLLNSNPDRGWRSEEIYFVPKIELLKSKPEDYTYEKLLALVEKNLEANTLGETVTISRVYFRMSNYQFTPELPDEVYKYIDNICKAYAKLGVKMYWEAYYQQGSYATEGAHKSVILKHLDTFGKIWKNNKDTIYAVCFGLIGGYGEWTTLGDNLIDEDIDPKTLSAEEREAQNNKGKREIADKLLSLLPKDTYLTMRRPELKNQTISKDNPKYYMIGFAQDAFFGKMFPYDDYGQGGWRPNDENEWWKMSIEESPYAPNDGELFTTRYFKDNGIYVEPYSSIQAFSELHETTFSVNHGYGDINTFNASLSETVLQGWKGEEITQEKLKELGVFYSPGWFKDDNGNTIKRNVFEYVRDYLGYRFSAKTLKISGGTKAGESIKLNMSLQNYGFSAAFNLKSGFAILDKDNKVVSEVFAGDPTKWHSSDPKNYSDRTLLTHKVETTMKLPKKSGTYKVAFFVRNNLGQTVRLDNSVEYKNGYNILHMFTIV